jgi:hypothetical protein
MVELHQSLGDRQPETGTAIRPRVSSVNLPEALEDQLLVLRSNSDPLIAHEDPDVFPLDLTSKLYALALVRELDSIVDQIGDHLA